MDLGTYYGRERETSEELSISDMSGSLFFCHRLNVMKFYKQRHFL